MPSAPLFAKRDKPAPAADDKAAASMPPAPSFATLPVPPPAAPPNLSTARAFAILPLSFAAASSQRTSVNPARPGREQR